MWKVLWAIRPLLARGSARRTASSRRPASLLEHLVEKCRSAYTSPPVARTSRAPSPAPSRDALAAFSPAVQDWFRASFEAPTDAQAQGWAAIARGEHTLIHAPTGSGKTLAAFLWCLDRLATDPRPAPTRETPASVRVLYVSPLKALTYDVERNLRAPLTGIAMAAERLGEPVPRISVASRTGDTPADDRRQIARHPPDILITTPESLYLMLTSAAREALRRVEVVIVDEVHAIAGTKRGSHLALSLERLEALRSAAGARRAADTADRPVRHATAARGDRPVPRRRRSGPRGDDRRCRHAQGRSTSRSSSRWTTWRRSARCCHSTSSRAARPPRATCGRASGRRSTRGSSS